MPGSVQSGGFSNEANVQGVLAVANGGTGVTTSTGTGSVVLSASPTFTGTAIVASLAFASGGSAPVLVIGGGNNMNYRVVTAAQHQFQVNGVTTLIVSEGISVYSQANAQRTGIDIGPTRGTLPVSAALAELTVYRTVDQATNFGRLNIFSAMAGSTYRFGQEAGGNQTWQDINFAQESNGIAGVTAGKEVYLSVLGTRINTGNTQRIQVGYGILEFSQPSMGGAPTNYWLGRSATVDLSFNVPTGSFISLSSYGATVIQVQGATAGGSHGFIFTPGAHTNVGGEANDILVQAHTITITSGFATNRFNWFRIPTILAATSQTVTTAATVGIEGAPAAAGAGPAIITNPLAFWVQAGKVRFDGIVAVGATSQTSFNAVGLATAYNGDTLAGTGIPSVVARVGLTAQAANIVATTLFATPAAGEYMIAMDLEVTTANTSGTLTGQVKYTDDKGAQTVTVDSVANTGLLDSGPAVANVIYFKCTTATNIQYLATLASQVGGNATYSIYITLWRVN